MPNPTNVSIAHPYGATVDQVNSIAALVTAERPEWDAGLVRVILLDLAPRMSTTELAILSLRAAKNRDLNQPRGIVWRGKHWDGLDTEPPTMHTNRGRCQVCGKPEAQCAYRPGRDDDHRFEPKR